MIIKTFKAYREAKREIKSSLKRFDEVIEEQGVDIKPLDDKTRKALDKAYEVTPENIKAVMNFHGIDEGTAESFLFILSFVNSPDFHTLIDLGMAQYHGMQAPRKIVDRAEMLPEFFQAILDVANAMVEGRIKAKPERVRKRFDKVFAKAFRPNESGFYGAVNELKNISTGMATF